MKTRTYAEIEELVTSRRKIDVAVMMVVNEGPFCSATSLRYFLYGSKSTIDRRNAVLPPILKRHQKMMAMLTKERKPAPPDKMPPRNDNICMA